MAKSKFTPENRAVILAHLRQGGSLASACRDIGVRLKTAEGWLTRGRREPDGDYADFAQQLDATREARERAEMSADEFDKHLAKAVRAGSVQAMKLWWDIHGRGAGDENQETNADSDPFAALENVTPLRRDRA